MVSGDLRQQTSRAIIAGNKHMGQSRRSALAGRICTIIFSLLTALIVGFEGTLYLWQRGRVARSGVMLMFYPRRTASYKLT